MKLIRDYNFATVFGEDPVADSRDIPTYVNVKFKYRRTNEGARSRASDSNFNRAANRSLVYPLEDRNRGVVGPSWYLGGKSNALTSILCISNSCFALWRKDEGLGANATKGVSEIARFLEQSRILKGFGKLIRFQRELARRFTIRCTLFHLLPSPSTLSTLSL